MDINRNNYEAFLLDLLEGRLSVEEERELNDFLNDHPELLVDLPDLDLLSLEKESVSYPLADQLRKEFPGADTQLSETNFDMFSIARMEGDLSPSQEQEYMSLLARDEGKKEDWQNWQRTILVPEPLSFPGKNGLKRKRPLRTSLILTSIISAAATLALVLILVRMEPAAPGLSQVDPEESSAVRETAELTQEAPVASYEVQTENREAPVAALQEAPLNEKPEPLQIVHTELPFEEEQEKTIIESSTRLSAETIESRPLRIADNLSITSELARNGTNDRIEPLSIPMVSRKSSGLPLNEIDELDRQLLFDELIRENNISLLSVANAGIKGINKLTGSDISLMASKDEQGDVSGFRLKSKRFSVSRPLAREE